MRVFFSVDIHKGHDRGQDHRAEEDPQEAIGLEAPENAEEEKERQLSPPDCNAQKLECEFREGKFLELVASAKVPNAPESDYWRSRAYNELAVQAFARLGQLPPSVEQHELKAHIYTGQKKYAEAAEEWRGALKFSPGDQQMQKQLAIALKFSQEYAQALSLFQELVRAQPVSAELNYLAGETLLDLQRVEEAIPLLRRAVLRDPKLVPAHKALARAYLAAGKAMIYFRRLRRTAKSPARHSPYLCL